jgi:invasion protein IalB
MLKWIVFAPVRFTVCALALALIGTAAIITITQNSFAEEKKVAPKKKDTQKDQQKGKPQSEAPPLIFSPWTKFCPKGQEANAQQVCFTGKDGRLESGQPVIAALLIEPQGEPRRILRVTLPLGMSLQPGTRVIIDQGQPMTAPYAICFNHGCVADYEASQALVDMMKKGQGMVIQGMNGAGQPMSLVLPLNDFAKAYDGPPIDPSELKRREEELRKKFEGQQK